MNACACEKAQQQRNAERAVAQPRLEVTQPTIFGATRAPSFDLNVAHAACDPGLAHTVWFVERVTGPEQAAHLVDGRHASLPPADEVQGADVGIEEVLGAEQRLHPPVRVRAARVLLHNGSQRWAALRLLSSKDSLKQVGR